jgi:hypothetical protein
MIAEGSTVSWIAETEEALRLAKNANEAQRQFTNLQDFKASFATLLTEFKELAVGAAVVRSLGWNGRLPPPDVRNDLREAVGGLEPRPLSRSVRSLERYKSDAKANLIEFWRQHAAERMGDLAEFQVLAATLSEVVGVADPSKRLEAILGELARTQSGFPSKHAAELLRDAESILRQLEESLQPESVRRFLSAATHGGASLEHLGDDVIDWLRSHNALHSFKIVAGVPTEAGHV